MAEAASNKGTSRLPRSSDIGLARRIRRRFPDGLSGYILIAPVLVAAVVFLYVPMTLSAYWSFTDFNGIRAPVWVGLANYRELLHDSEFLQSVKNTGIFVLLGQGSGPILGLASALLLNTKLRLTTVFRAAYFIPVMTSIVVVSVIWKMLLNPQGLINEVFRFLHLPTANWLSNTSTALPAVIVSTVWQGFGFETVIFLAALQAIPKEYYEAATVDGASTLQRFRHITLPGLRPTIIFVYVIGIIQSSQVFDQIFVMTQGGPINSTATVVYELIGRFNSLELGQASAIAYLLMAVLAVASLLQLRLFERPQ